MDDQKSIHHEAVKDFVVTVLGCRCPESVFQTIEVTENHPPVNGVAVQRRINIGNRLLVWLVSADGLTEPAEQLQTLVMHGVAERNREGFNRFRLVLLTSDEQKTGAELNPVINAVALPDERAHFHIIPEKAAEEILH